MSEIKTRKFKCTGCGEDRPCYLETNRESSIMDVYTEDVLKCVLDETNQTSHNWEEMQANGVSDNHEKALPINSVSHRIDFEKLRQAYFNECVDKTNGKSKLYVCLAPHDLFEWFRKELLEYGG